jgi:preprotein translocase subunit SecE
VARQTRDERRKRRAQAEASNDRATRPPREAARPVPEAAVHAPEPRRGHFLAESYAELRKVEWPRQQQVIQGTVVVLVACIVVGVYLWGADQVFQRLVEKVLLR